MQTVFMFSGQGSQYFHMGKALYENNAAFRGWMQRLDETARAASGTSVVEALYAEARQKGEPFDRTLLTHPAIFMVEYSLAQCLMDAGVWPDLVLGASVGSFAAAAVAGFLEAEDALKAVIRQAVALEEGSEPGGMIAILADPALFGEEFLRGRSELAGVNFASHFVISARQAELAEIESTLKKRNVTYQRLPVEFPFHSQWMDEAKAPFASFMQSVQCRQGRLPLACSDRTEVLSTLSDGFFWDVVRNPIRFREMTARLEQEGARRYIDVGPAGTLATFLKYGLPATTQSTIHSILTPFGLDQKNLAAVVAAAAH
jgi:bacillaene synthase trans-acting acyltransferase